MAEEITRALARLRADADRCAPLSATAIRRRGERRRTGARVVAVGGTVAIVGATVGTAVAVSDETGSGHDGTHAAGRPGAAQSAELARLNARVATLHAELVATIQQQTVAIPVGSRDRHRELAARIAELRAQLSDLRGRLAALEHHRRAAVATPRPGPSNGSRTAPTSSPTPFHGGTAEPIATPHPGLSTARPSTLPTPTPTPTHR